MIPRTVNIICAKRPVRSGCVPARRVDWMHSHYREANEGAWYCSFCGNRVKVVA